MKLDAMTAAVKYKPTDRVVYRLFASRKHGTVRTVARSSAMVDFDDGTQERVPLGTLSPETAEDIARRDHEQAMRAWRARQPLVTQVIVFENVMGHRDHVSLSTSSPEEMREAAAELLKLADWFAERPVKP